MNIYDYILTFSSSIFMWTTLSFIGKFVATIIRKENRNFDAHGVIISISFSGMVWAGIKLLQ